MPHSASSGETAAEEFAARCARERSTAKTNKWRTVQGDVPQWLFLARELEHLAHGSYWEKAGRGGLPDPATEIVRYHQDLKEIGITLLLVPVPAKASIYPEKYQNASPPEAVTKNAPFYEILRKGGVDVLDLEPLFATEIAKGAKLYCEQDSHWSPLACELVAAKIHDQFKGETWATGSRKDIVRGPKETLSIKGDLVEERLKKIGMEKLDVVKVGTRAGAKIVAVNPDATSPVILLGDSHALVFSEDDDMHCTGSGLLDHLQQKFAMPLDLIANKASGGDQARVSLARKAHGDPDYLKGKKLLIWCFSAREFTLGKWRKFPPIAGKR